MLLSLIVVWFWENTSAKIGIPIELDPDYNACFARQNDARSAKWHICLHGGTCINDPTTDKGYKCQCDKLHDGHRCEYEFESTRCSKQPCYNGGSCFGLVEPERPMPNRGAAAETAHELGKPDEKYYQCKCPPDYFGERCEISPKMRECENWCHRRAIVTHDKWLQWGGVCRCQCEKGFFGERCEHIDPCNDIICLNNGECVNGQCRCDQSSQYIIWSNMYIFGIDTRWLKFAGDRCEILADYSDENYCNPCDESRQIQCLKHYKEVMGRVIALNADNTDRVDELTKKYNYMVKSLGKNACFGRGVCQAALYSLSANMGNDMNLYLYGATCNCTDLNSYGDLCENRNENRCQLTPDEKNAFGEIDGNGDQYRCKNGGTCASDFNDQMYTCICPDGYKGDICEEKDPCFGNPCGDGHCVQVPENLGTRFDYEFYCLCPINDAGVNCEHTYINNNINCSQASCSHGRGVCLSCNLFEEASIVCGDNENDMRRGFKCICIDGHAGANCEHEFDACSAIDCHNGGHCKLIASTNYKCECLSGFGGDYCEILVDPCAQIEAQIACSIGSGTCKPDPDTELGYLCDCKDGYSGFRCEYPPPNFLKKWSWVIYPGVSAMISCLFVIVKLFVFNDDFIDRLANAVTAKKENDVNV